MVVVGELAFELKDGKVVLGALAGNDMSNDRVVRHETRGYGTTRYSVPVTTRERVTVHRPHDALDLHDECRVTALATEIDAGEGLFTVHVLFRGSDSCLHEFRALKAMPNIWNHYVLATNIDSETPRMTSAWFGKRRLTFAQNGAQRTLEFDSWAREWR